MTAVPLADRPTAIYRLFGDKELLYVGISCDPDGRLLDHEAKKSWWPEVSHVKVSWFRNRADALRGEAWAIATEVPLYNDSRPNPQHFGSPDAESGGPMGLSRLSVGEAAKHLRIPPPELLDLARKGALPHNRAGSKVWFSRNHIKRIEIRMTARNLAVGNAYVSAALQGIAQA